MKNLPHAGERQPFEDTLGDERVWAACVQEAIEIANGGALANMKGNSASSAIIAQVRELHWITSTSDKERSIRWVARILGLDPDEFQNIAIRCIREDLK